MEHLVRVIVGTTETDDLSVGGDYWLCEDCMDRNGVEGEVIDEGVSLKECYVCGIES